jgi:hypothetical protein
MASNGGIISQHSIRNDLEEAVVGSFDFFAQCMPRETEIPRNIAVRIHSVGAVI